MDLKLTPINKRMDIKVVIEIFNNEEKMGVSYRICCQIECVNCRPSSIKNFIGDPIRVNAIKMAIGSCNEQNVFDKRQDFH